LVTSKVSAPAGKVVEESWQPSALVMVTATWPLAAAGVVVPSLEPPELELPQADSTSDPMSVTPAKLTARTGRDAVRCKTSPGD
jgi:hypothetical protein